MDELTYIVNHSEATHICVDETMLTLAEALAPHVPRVKAWIVMSDRPLRELDTSLKPLHHHEDLLAAAVPITDWPMIDERSAYAACYTTGTTGRSKGIYYSHRSMYLHSLNLVAMVGMTMDDCTMLVTPMFHAQGWGLPQAATMMANKILLPGRYSTEDAAFLIDSIVAERVTLASGVPSIMTPLLNYIRTLPVKPSLRGLRLLCGGSEAPLSLMMGWHELTGAEVIHAYGSTETSPLLTVNRLKATLRGRLSAEEEWNVRRTQGLPGIGVDIKILAEDGRELPHDGESVGEICARGPWVATSYHDMPGVGRSIRRRLLALGRPRCHRRPRLSQAHGPAQRCDQERRRVDLLHRHGERAGRARIGAGGSGRRSAPSAVAGAAARARGAGTGPARNPGGAPPASRRNVQPLATAGPDSHGAEHPEDP